DYYCCSYTADNTLVF
nr:immunoglobulin light chain junction region [Macaca mulatta]